jgi:hypothetical protein
MGEIRETRSDRAFLNSVQIVNRYGVNTAHSLQTNNLKREIKVHLARSRILHMEIGTRRCVFASSFGVSICYADYDYCPPLSFG